ncbi:protein retinal degeneration B isoform X4 [Vespula maculifrons]|uniref:Protein retinal degeneration B isoform X4 n=1 Tax=Vespula maculifrons TaxID=7453 RepID=A0ABD2BIC5_VESMC
MRSVIRIFSSNLSRLSDPVFSHQVCTYTRIMETRNFVKYPMMIDILYNIHITAKRAISQPTVGKIFPLERSTSLGPPNSPPNVPQSAPPIKNTTTEKL